MPDNTRTRSLRPGTPPPVESFELPRGHLVADWVIGDRLGGGGFGDVYAAQQVETAQHVAIKVLHAHFVASAEMLARFEREIQVLQRLRHPNVVQIVDAGFESSGRPYLCMELLAGRDLNALIKSERGLHSDLARRIFEPLCEAIAFAHDQAVIHRDLKASNVFVCDDGRVVLLDFGIAKLSDALAPELTASHQSLGTPGCMAPEQIHGSPADVRTDVYSLGALLFYMLTGQQPFYDPSETMTQYLHLHARRPRASALVPEVAPLDDVIVRAMAIEPNERFQDVRALLSAARAAMRKSRPPDSVTTQEHAAILVTVEDRTAGTEFDEALLVDLEAVLPTAERALSELGFTLALDLGSSALFIAPFRDASSAIEVALTTWDKLARRPACDSRVRVGVVVHKGPATLAGNRVQSGPVLQPETWGIPDQLDGVWVTNAIDAQPRRLR